MKTETQIREEIEGLRNLTTAQLKEKYREVFGEQFRSNHKQFLFRRVAWRIQANAWGGLSERARRRALELADDDDLRIRAPKSFLREPIDDGRTLEARLEEWKAKRTGKPPILPRRMFDLVAHGFQADGGKAARDLGIQYTPIKDSLRQAVRWYWEQVLLRRKPACVTQ